ncbi:MAG: antibiotic biosynthesis monooxygenase [Myxococcota bacterium]|nr:antibiotic biosynthesis monooxygenase [Myxococcota bacterium]
MILESVILDVKPGLEEDFESAFAQAREVVSLVPGYCSHELLRCLEAKSRYLLQIRWTSLESHTEGFRRSPEYQRWKDLLHHFYPVFPTVEHYEEVFSGSRAN